MRRPILFAVPVVFLIAALAWAADDQGDAKLPPPGSIAGAKPLKENTKSKDAQVDTLRGKGVLDEDANEPAPKPDSYWLGVECGPLPKVLLMHLNLPENQGILITRVVLDSPAAKAGLVAGDILLSADGKKLQYPAEMVDVVTQAHGKPIAFELIHAGKPKSIKVTPEARPASAPEQQPVPQANDNDWQQIQQWLQRMRPGANGGNAPPMNLPDPNAMQFRFFFPGAILPQQGAAQALALPGDTSISISKSGDQPAQITVRKDGKEWKITEKELDKLPADVRPSVERMLSGVTIQTGPNVFNFGPKVAPPPGTPRRPAGKTLPPGVLHQQLQQQMDDMNRRMDEIQKRYNDEMRQRVEEMKKQIDEMQEEHP
jgi:membrane-associated protease RseP (regulator of RpoE activity)